MDEQNNFQVPIEPPVATNQPPVPPQTVIPQVISPKKNRKIALLVGIVSLIVLLTIGLVFLSNKDSKPSVETSDTSSNQQAIKAIDTPCYSVDASADELKQIGFEPSQVTQSQPELCRTKLVLSESKDVPAAVFEMISGSYTLEEAKRVFVDKLGADDIQSQEKMTIGGLSAEFIVHKDSQSVSGSSYLILVITPEYELENGSVSLLYLYGNHNKIVQEGLDDLLSKVSFKQ